MVCALAGVLRSGHAQSCWANPWLRVWFDCRCLSDVHILFTRAFPNDRPPQSAPIWNKATALGAVCHTKLNSKITHLVAGAPGTDKIDQVRKSKRRVYIVHTDWVFACYNQVRGPLS